jgi:hypothetical protein
MGIHLKAYMFSLYNLCEQYKLNAILEILILNQNVCKYGLKDSKWKLINWKDGLEYSNEDYL